MKKRLTFEEIAQVKAEGRQYGWLRSRLLGLPWPREGISNCGRLGCPVCDAIPDRTGDQSRPAGRAR
jgi:hypothetical protein